MSTIFQNYLGVSIYLIAVSIAECSTQLHAVSLSPPCLLHLFNLENAVLLSDFPCFFYNCRLSPFSLPKLSFVPFLLPARSPGLPLHPSCFHSSSPDLRTALLLLHPGSHFCPSCIQASGCLLHTAGPLKLHLYN